MSDEEKRAGANPAPKPETTQMLQNDLAECSRLFAYCAEQASAENWSFDARMHFMEAAAKLMRASTSAASILMRPQGTTHRVVVDRGKPRPVRTPMTPEREAEINRIAAEYYARREAEGDTSSENSKTTSSPARVRQP